MARRLAGQTLAVPDVTGAAGDAFSDAHPFVKLIIILMVVFLGLELYGRWTGQYVGQVNLLGTNRIGSGILAAQHPPTNTQTRAGQAGFNLPHSTGAMLL